MIRSRPILRVGILCAVAGALAAGSRLTAADSSNDPPDENIDHSGIGSVSEQLRKLLPVTVIDNRLTLDQDAWERGQEQETPEEKRKNVTARLARQMRIKPEQVPVQFVNNAMNQTEMAPVEAYQDIVAQIGGGAGGSSSSGGRSFSMQQDGQNLRSMISINLDSHDFEVRFAEKTYSKRLFAITDDKQFGFVVQYADGSKARGFVFVQSPAGPVSLAAYDGSKGIALTGANFLDMLHKDSATTLTYFIRPLMALGIDLPFSRQHPAVKTMASSGFNPAAADVAQKVQALLKSLDDDDQDVREKAYKDLVPLYPKAILEFSEALKSAQDTEVKRRLETAANTYPTLQLAREYVLLEKLHEDRAYLIGLLKDPAYKAGARARLTALVGKDYGEDPAAWPAK